MAVYAAGKNLSIPISYGQGVVNIAEIAGITPESGDGRKHPPICDKTHHVHCTENDWRYGKRQVNLGIIESYLVKYSVLSLSNENEQVKKVTKCIN